MFSNAVLIDGTEKTLDDIFLSIAKCIKECASNDEAYVTFKFVNVPEQTIKNLDLALKKLHYDDDADEKKTKHWYLRISWTVANSGRGKRGLINDELNSNDLCRSASCGLCGSYDYHKHSYVCSVNRLFGDFKKIKA